MTATSMPRPALVPRRRATTSGPLRQARVDALIGAVLDEMGAVGVARTTATAVQPAPRRKTSSGRADG